MVCSALEPDLHSLQSPPPNGDAAAAAAPFRRVLLHPLHPQYRALNAYVVGRP